MSRMIRRIEAFLLVLVLLVGFVTGMWVLPCNAEEQNTSKVIRVGWFDTDENSKAHEYDYTYLQALSQYTGWTYEYVPGSWDECLKSLENGDIDIMSFVVETEERKEKYGYPLLPMSTTSAFLVTNVNNNISESDLSSMQGIKVGVVAGNAYNEDFNKYCTVHEIKAETVTYDSLKQISPALESGEIDAAVVAEEDRTANEHVLVNLASKSQYFVTDIDNPELLSELDNAMKQVQIFCPYLNNDLYQKYFAVDAGGQPNFTQDELQFIKDNPDILVLLDAGWQPIEYFDKESGTYKGVFPDLLKMITKKTGLNFVIDGTTSTQNLAELESGEHRNVVASISYDYDWAEKHDVYITQPFISSAIVKFGSNFDDKDASIAINANAYYAFAVKDELTGHQTVSFDHPSDRLEAVRKGKVDYTIISEDQANYFRSMPKYKNIKVQKMDGYEQKVCVSISRNSDPELMSIMSKALASITHDEITAIIRENTVNIYKWTFSDYVYANFMYYVIVLILIIIISMSVIIVNKNRRRNNKELQIAFEQKQKALNEAEKASAAKGEFMSNMSHEIRTPLNAIIGYITIAEKEMSQAKTEQEHRQASMKVMDCLMKSNIASKHLLTVINDVLDMSAIESGKIKIAKDRFDFKSLIVSLTTVFYSQAKEKDLNFEVIFDSLTEEWFVGDPLRTNQILTNLLSNAVKFTPSGGTVKLEIKQPEAGINASHVQFTVSDTGIGMTDEFLNHIWEPFEQADASISRRFGGTGLGMTITKTLVDLMGGTIMVESSPGKGTTFHVDLTFGCTNQPVSGGMYDFSSVHALIVDDDMSTCEYVKLLFERCKARCVTALSGERALEEFTAAEKQNDKFTLCLVDWCMPKMDGIETIKQIRSIAGNEIPIIVITAYDYSELADQAAEVGIDKFIPKPLFQSSLFDLLENLCGKTVPEEVEKDEDIDFGGVRVLLTEDNKMNMEVARYLLESYGLVVDSAWDGQEAVDMFAASEEGTYALVLMDVHMPKMNGYQATCEIRKLTHPQAQSIPIIAMTADAFSEDVAEAQESGMNDHISKPIDNEILVDKLRKYIK